MIEDAIAKSRERFVRETAEHQMTVRHDDGLYRHLRFQQPGTWAYGFDIVTWPGYLAIVGDCGDYVFSRVRDMFEFFGARTSSGHGFEDARWGINPQYWQEKLQAPRPDAAERYSHDALKRRLQGWLTAVSEELDAGEANALRGALQEQVLDDERARWSESHAHELLRAFEHDGTYPLQDAWEWSLREYDWQFLWCCWAIVWAIGQYRAAHGEKEAA